MKLVRHKGVFLTTSDVANLATLKYFNEGVKVPSKKSTESRFSDYILPTPKLEGEQVDIDEILDGTILITDYAILTGKFGEFAVIQYSNEGKLYTTACGGTVVVRKLKEFPRDMLPILATITKPARYYDIA